MGRGTNYCAKLLNSVVTGSRFENKDIDNYLYASLSKPPIRIIDKRGSTDEMDFIVECPCCHNHVCYGTDTFMYSGFIYCSTNGCRDKVVKDYMKYVEAKWNE